MAQISTIDILEAIQAAPDFMWTGNDEEDLDSLANLLNVHKWEISRSPTREYCLKMIRKGV